MPILPKTSTSMSILVKMATIMERKVEKEMYPWMGVLGLGKRRRKCFEVLYCC
jgi:hypothetical protein